MSTDAFFVKIRNYCEWSSNIPFPKTASPSRGCARVETVSSILRGTKRATARRIEGPISTTKGEAA
ncbi:hypothetical protein [Novosphingobium humi]|uniref:hypothetical protein n=1 Tax=Novosphingobium humi TaxID=2282397 RepID=UPI0025AF925E|nr:hypothetical protein [Novosphingobium humi]WJS97374.1 hypothetical protein NYQ05_09345 [Novosphingobium humi]